MDTTDSLIAYQFTATSACIEFLTQEFGSQLEKLTAVDKLDLLGILAFWQSSDTQALRSGSAPVTLAKFLGLNDDLLLANDSGDLDRALEILSFDCSERDALTLIVSISNQLRQGLYS